MCAKIGYLPIHKMLCGDFHLLEMVRLEETPNSVLKVVFPRHALTALLPPSPGCLSGYQNTVLYIGKAAQGKYAMLGKKRYGGPSFASYQ